MRLVAPAVAPSGAAGCGYAWAMQARRAAPRIVLPVRRSPATAHRDLARLGAHTRLLELQATVGNHTVVQLLRIQRSPDDSLPWRHDGSTLFEVTASGIHFLVGLRDKPDREKAIRGVIGSIGTRIAADNAVIKDAAFQVTTCFIVPTSTRFALLAGKGALLLAPEDANLETAAHEMGHAVFYYLRNRAGTQEKDASGAASVRLQVGDIFARLSDTKVTRGKGKDAEELPAGLWIADPSQWDPGQKEEHPQADPDEFFASAKAGLQVFPDGFKKAIARYSKIDPAVAAPARDLVSLLAAVMKGELPMQTLADARQKAASDALKREKSVGDVEDSVVLSPLLNYLVHPESRPRVKAR